MYPADWFHLETGIWSSSLPKNVGNFTVLRPACPGEQSPFPRKKHRMAQEQSVTWDRSSPSVLVDKSLLPTVREAGSLGSVT